MAAFLSRTVDGVLKRGSRHAALGRFWLPASSDAVGLAPPSGGTNPSVLWKSDGADVWATLSAFSLARAGADGKLLGTWTASGARLGVLAAFGRVIVAGASPRAISITWIRSSRPAP